MSLGKRDKLHHTMLSDGTALAWVNDEVARHAYGSAGNADKTFRRMLKKGTPPDTWEALLEQAQLAVRAKKK